MNKTAIIKTALLRWSDDDECFVVQSPIFTRVVGVGDTENGAWQVFHEILDETYEDYKKGNLAGYAHPGRPRKNKVKISAEIKPDIRDELRSLAKQLGISQGEVIEYLIAKNA